MPNSPKSSGNGFLHWLGRQVGHVKKAIETDVTTTKTIYKETQVEEKQLPDDPNIKLRRTTIDEVIHEKPKKQ